MMSIEKNNKKKKKKKKKKKRKKREQKKKINKIIPLKLRSNRARSKAAVQAN